jgi:polycystin 1L2
MNSFGFGWTQCKQNYTPPFGYQAMYNSFQFKNAQTLQGSPIQGKYDTYDGSGYVYEMRGQLSYIQGNLSLLKEMNWIDRQTRAVFVEFSTYNPNINLIMVTTILIEFLSSGSILVTPRFDTVNLFSDIGGWLSFKTICEICFYIFIGYSIIIEIRKCIKMGIKRYLTEFWNLIELAIITTACISFVMTILRLIAANAVLDFFRTTGGYGYIKLQTVNGYNQILTYCLGLCASIGAIKLLKMLRFNQNITILGLTLKRCFEELASFSVVFFIIWISFVQIMYLIFNQNLEGYSSLIKSMESAFEIMIGKFSALPFMQSNSILGPIIVSAYNSVILFFALNIFISIIIDSFDKVRGEAKLDPEKFGFLNHILDKFKCLFRKKDNNSAYIEYKSHLDILPSRIDNVIDYLIRVKYFLIILFITTVVSPRLRF